MSKLKKEELLEWLDVWFRFYSTEFIPQLRALSPKKAEKIYPHKEQAYQQIKEMIQAYAEHQEIKADYMNMILQRDLFQAQLEKKPEVTEEIVGKCAMKLVSFIGYPKKAREGKIYSTMQVIREMFKEAGVKVVGK